MISAPLTNSERRIISAIPSLMSARSIGMRFSRSVTDVTSMTFESPTTRRIISVASIADGVGHDAVYVMLFEALGLVEREGDKLVVFCEQLLAGHVVGLGDYPVKRVYSVGLLGIVNILLAREKKKLPITLPMS